MGYYPEHKEKLMINQTTIIRDIKPNNLERLALESAPGESVKAVPCDLPLMFPPSVDHCWEDAETMVELRRTSPRPEPARPQK